MSTTAFALMFAVIIFAVAIAVAMIAHTIVFLYDIVYILIGCFSVFDNTPMKIEHSACQRMV